MAAIEKNATPCFFINASFDRSIAFNIFWIAEHKGGERESFSAFPFSWEPCTLDIGAGGLIQGSLDLDCFQLALFEQNVYLISGPDISVHLLPYFLQNLCQQRKRPSTRVPDYS
jgi:hypothetical protein